MDVRFASEASCKSLLSSVSRPEGFASYQSLELDFKGLELLRQKSGISINGDVILNPDAKADGQNSILLHRAFENLRPNEAADKRLWVSLTHDRFREYTYKRWVKDRKVEQGTICARFHFEGRGMETRMRNAISRLWWAAEMTVDRDNVDDPYKYTRILWSNQDMFAGLTERSIGTYPSVLRAILEVVEMAPKIKEEKRRFWLASINAAGGVKSLPALDELTSKKLMVRLAENAGII